MLYGQLPSRKKRGEKILMGQLNDRGEHANKHPWNNGYQAEGTKSWATLQVVIFYGVCLRDGNTVQSSEPIVQQGAKAFTGDTGKIGFGW